MGFFKSLWSSVKDVVKPIAGSLAGAAVLGPVGGVIGGGMGLDSVRNDKYNEAMKKIQGAYGNMPPPPSSTVAGGIPIGTGAADARFNGGGAFGFLGQTLNTIGQNQGGVRVPTQQTPYDPSGFFKDINPVNNEGLLSGVGMYNAGQNIRGITPFDPTGYFSGITPYDPSQALHGMVPPALERMLQEGTISQSEFANIQTDPELKGMQMRALGKVQELAEQGGLSVQDRVRMREILDQVTRQTRQNIGALRTRYEAMGLGGSGVELASSLAQEQGMAEGASKLGAEVAAMAADREFAAIQEAGKLAGTIRAQDFEEASRRAEAIDSINRFNAAQRSQIYQTDWLNRLNLATTGAQLGQQAYENRFNLAGAQANAGQTAYENKYNQALNLDQFARQEWADRFSQAQSIADARRNYWSDTFDLQKTRANAGQIGYTNAFNAANTRFNQELARASQIDDYNYRIWSTQVNAASGQRNLEAQLAIQKANQPSGIMQLLGGAMSLGGMLL